MKRICYFVAALWTTTHLLEGVEVEDLYTFPNAEYCVHLGEKSGANAAAVWKDLKITGNGVVIGICGGAVLKHPDLKLSNYNPAANWRFADYSQGLSYYFDAWGTTPKKANAHEMGGAGVAAARGIGTIGAAPNATVAGITGYSTVRYLWGSGVNDRTSSYVRDTAIDVKNFYVGTFYRDFSEDSKNIALASKNNTVFTCSAYNSRGNKHQYDFPTNSGWLAEANVRQVINVAANHGTGYAIFSNYGSNVFVSAYGYNVPSLGFSETTPTYPDFSGTSSSAPITAGVIALGKEICDTMDSRWTKHALAQAIGHRETPNIDPNGTRRTTDEFLANASPTGTWQKNKAGYWFNNNYGFGKVDALAFVQKTKDILYTTSEALIIVEAQEMSASSLLENSGHFSQNWEFKKDLSQNIETVSLNVNFSDASKYNLNLSTVTIKMIAPNGDESIFVQPSLGDLDKPNNLTGFSFLSNAFWGSNYNDDLGNWKIEVSYSANAGTDTTGWISIKNVEFSTGNVVWESEKKAHTIGVGTHNLHSIVMDTDISLSVAGNIFLEDVLDIRAGTFTLEKDASIANRSDDAFYATKEVQFLQSGGKVEIAGNAEFLRGMELSGGELVLDNVDKVIKTTELKISDAGAIRIGEDLALKVLGSSGILLLEADNIYFKDTLLSEDHTTIFSKDLWRLDFLAANERAQLWLYEIPEPSTFGIFAGTLALMLALSRRRKRK